MQVHQEISCRNWLTQSWGLQRATVRRLQLETREDCRAGPRLSPWPENRGPTLLTPGAPTSGGGRRRTSQLKKREAAWPRLQLMPTQTGATALWGGTFTDAPGHDAPPAGWVQAGTESDPSRRCLPLSTTCT